MPPPFGAHVSVAGGLVKAFERGDRLGAEALQIFVKSPNQWRGRTVADEEIDLFRRARLEAGSPPLIAHAAYLINLATADARVRDRSIDGLVDELERSKRLGLDALVVHPGSHVGAGPAAGIAQVAEALPRIVERVAAPPPVLLETTAGQGTNLGRTLEELEAMIEQSGLGDRVGVCLDTCHLLAAGYAVDTPEGADAVVREALRRFGETAVAAVHLNDSKFPRSSRRDRHANLGEGHIPLEAFRAFLAALPPSVPCVLETPAGDESAGHRRDLALLRGLF